MATLVPAMCTQCGSTVKVNRYNDAAICDFCGTPFVIQKAINKYNVNIKSIEKVENLNVEGSINMGPSADNLARRGLQFFKSGEIDRAEKYFNRALDIDCDNVYALKGIAAIEEVYEARRREAEEEQRRNELIGNVVATIVILFILIIGLYFYFILDSFFDSLRR